MDLLPARLFVGVDWATQEHQVCILSPPGDSTKQRSFAHSGEGLAALVAYLAKLTEGHLDEIHVGIEVPHGAVVETLLEHGCQVFSINPKQLDRFRDRFSLAGAKDDRRDAYVLAASLRTDRHSFRHLRIDKPLVIELREWSRIHDELSRERTRLTNRLCEQFRRYFPQYLDLSEDVGDKWLLALWKLAPTPARAQKVRPSTVAKLLKRHRIRRIQHSEVLEILRKPAVCVAPGTTEAATAHIALLVERLKVVNKQMHKAAVTLDTILEKMSITEETDSANQKSGEQRDSDILLSLPGVGRIVLSTLLGEASQIIHQQDYHALRALTGVAPVTLRSGKSCRVVMRQACHPRLRLACYHWARVAMQRDPRCREIYTRARKRGKKHGTALRILADYLVSVACSMLRHRTLYDPHRNRALSASQTQEHTQRTPD